MADVVIFGTGDFARIASVYLDVDSDHEVVAFTADREHIGQTEMRGRPVLPYDEVLESHPASACQMLVAIGFSKVNQARAAVFNRVKDDGYELISYVNSKADLWGETSIGENCFIFEENVIQPYVTIGDDCVLWSGNHIGHDATIGDHCFIASHVVISGNVTVGDYSFIGVNATLRDGVTVGASNVIGGGATIMQDTGDGDVFAVPHTEVYRKKSHELRNF